MFETLKRVLTIWQVRFHTKNFEKRLCQKQGILGDCNSGVILGQNYVTVPSYCHPYVKEVSRYLWYKFQVKEAANGDFL